MRRGGRTGGPGNRLQGLPVVEVLMGRHDQSQLRCVLTDECHQQFRVVGGVDQQRLAGVGTGHQIGVVVHRANRHLDDGGPGKGPPGRVLRLDVAGVGVVDDCHGGHVTVPRGSWDQLCRHRDIAWWR